MAGAGKGLFAYAIGFFIVTKAHVGWFFVHEIPSAANEAFVFPEACHLMNRS